MIRSFSIGGCFILILLVRSDIFGDQPEKIRPKWIPSTAKEISCDELVVLQSPDSVEEVKLGVMETGQDYFISVPFINMFGTDFRIKEVRTSCGYLAAAIADETIPHKGKGSFGVRSTDCA